MELYMFSACEVWVFTLSIDPAPPPNHPHIAGKGRVCLRKGAEDGMVEVVVAVRQRSILATAFHPELTTERWWHEYFVSLCR